MNIDLLQIALTAASIAFGLISSACWLYSAKVKVSWEKSVDMRRKEAKKTGAVPNLGGVSLDGWDMSATFTAQSKWSGRGAVFAALAIAAQSLQQILIS